MHGVLPLVQVHGNVRGVTQAKPSITQNIQGRKHKDGEL